MRALPIILLVAIAAFGADTKMPEPDARGGTIGGEVLTSVCFGTTLVMGIHELKTNAIYALNRKGHSITNLDRCAVNVQVGGKDPGCAVIFWDLHLRMTYQVVFDGRGQVVHVSGGKMLHGGAAPAASRHEAPKVNIGAKP